MSPYTTTPSGNWNKHRMYQENTKSPADPVYLDIDQSLVNRKNNPHSDQKMPFSADVRSKVKHWLHKGWVALLCKS